MKRILSLFFILTLVGCGKDYDPNLDRPHVNKDLSVYVNRFVQVSESVGRPVSLGRIQVDFVDSMEGRVIGKCYSGYMTPRVEINRRYWESTDTRNSDRESLVFHELGHCILGRGHNSGSIPGYDYLEVSIMNPVHLPRSTYEYNWQYYMRELFGIPFYFTQSAVSQFPAEYYETPGLVPIATSEIMFCKLGGDCDGAVSASEIASPDEYEKVYSTTQDDLGEGFHCEEESH